MKLEPNIDPLIREMSISDVEDVVSIHLLAFPDFFLSFLGKGFLKMMYTDFFKDVNAICLIAETNYGIVGFIAGNLHPVHLFRRMILERGFLFLGHSLRAFLVHPILVIKKLIRAITYRGEEPVGFNHPALISSIGVNPEIASKGIGSLLVNRFCERAFSDHADVVYLTTDRNLNDKANHFYKKNSFQLEGVVDNTENRKMNRYVRYPNEKDL